MHYKCQNLQSIKLDTTQKKMVSGAAVYEVLEVFHIRE